MIVMSRLDTFWVASSCCFFIFNFLLHCLHSMSERLGRIISNTFTVQVSADKFWHALVIAMPTMKIDKFVRASRVKAFTQDPSALSAVLCTTVLVSTR